MLRFLLNLYVDIFRMDHEGDRRIGQLLQTVDELVKIAPELIAGARAPPTVSISV